MEMQQRVVDRAQQLKASGALDAKHIGHLTGLWVSQKRALGETSPRTVRSIQQLDDVLIYLLVDSKTGETGTGGFAELRGGVWRGYWSLACEDCCPGVTWWDGGVLAVSSDGGSAEVRIRSKKLDHKTCKLSAEPDDVIIPLDKVNALHFKPFAPGKLIYIIAAPAVGNQGSQYKAAIDVAWDLRDLGVSRVALSGGGQKLEDTNALSGMHRLLTDKSGPVSFLLVGFNSAGTPLHAQSLAIEIPAIPGIGR
ncbi:MAG: hypothetical protein LC689_17890 [Myxococcales bacterium]|nr:hypothetical protein [Myxococcales bacterium]